MIQFIREYWFILLLTLMFALFLFLAGCETTGPFGIGLPKTSNQNQTPEAVATQWTLISVGGCGVLLLVAGMFLTQLRPRLSSTLMMGGAGMIIGVLAWGKYHWMAGVILGIMGLTFIAWLTKQIIEYLKKQKGKEICRLSPLPSFGESSDSSPEPSSEAGSSEKSKENKTPPHGTSQ